MTRQRTIAREAFIEGVGLHTGNMTRATFRPAPSGSGITLTRVDLKDRPSIKAGLTHVLGVTRGTTLGTEIFAVHTVEHLLASCYAAGIDNMEILLSNNEPPVLDGSAKLFTELLLSAGATEQDGAKRTIVINKPITYEAGTTKITAEPCDDFIIDCTIAFKHPALAHQQLCINITPDVFAREIAPARTFCFDYEIEALKNKGLARGGDLTNAIVVGIDGIHNPDKNLRFKDEFVRHKILDMVGDFYLLGAPVKGKITALRCGHGHNIKFANEILKNSTISGD
ncbi:MAG TPA: UDP-3-O-[3-hydroxymyristoyl] N-acetylglucosamine deacetylase [Elusimicrobia bacterium]|nr:MAG: UDP-3-O-[3-hydroxymyristoyl] N-acetylglucosamine deacetylase [Elusimicrobia bacterium RIFOXYA12_FULL_49_49]OGS09479.1 MAG: UDP-3-O-[3-hydroxymyristoyl] N-acetylglucosamine deacetylase [Elusimicrobia bacterium RIFOXYB1_FULL_48_9]OGS15912.1 MAG: UDP-3-O-[3-hydroxymyristoyl] N-acetylglucosamine deacetylase [Elusimicrobia bacterium RIFOXYA2_FULL_47_53]OGS26406.1 MAG: UDP-3-O-[3-hydroxymyristoyl] N-acetylglucosamine deacetylase [Elusimicrobia bacterium RIFOXYB12_FULL_50_12]OGS29080.1 MAG: UD